LQISFNQSYFGAFYYIGSGSHRNTDIGLSQCRASLIPSPAMATILPWSCNLLISFNLSSGRQPAMKDVKCIRQQLYGVSLSPVSIITSIPWFINSFIAATLVLLIASVIVT
jgi:hypothetical protein